MPMATIANSHTFERIVITVSPRALLLTRMSCKSSEKDRSLRFYRSAVGELITSCYGLHPYLSE